MYQHQHSLRVRYAETDQMGFVYHGHYITFHEVARVEAMRDLGCDYAALEKSGVLMPVLSLQAKFVRPAYFDDWLTIHTTVPQLPTARMEFRYEIFGDEGEKKHEGSTLLAFLDKNTLRPCRAPKELIDALKPHFKQLDKT